MLRARLHFTPEAFHGFSIRRFFAPVSIRAASDRRRVYSPDYRTASRLYREVPVLPPAGRCGARGSDTEARLAAFARAVAVLSSQASLLARFLVHLASPARGGYP